MANIPYRDVYKRQEQKKYLFERLELESLCFSEQNRVNIEQFEQATSGNKIAEYLINEAWEDDKDRNTKVYLVRDKNTREIAYYFAINCGILYSEIEEIQLTAAEKEPFERYIKALQPVSYTHLDVYKRQAIYFSQRQR